MATALAEETMILSRAGDFVEEIRQFDYGSRVGSLHQIITINDTAFHHEADTLQQGDVF
jgi:hypothetical protein